MSNHIKPFSQYITESYNEDRLGMQFSQHFDIRAYSDTYGNSGKITIQTRGEIYPDAFEEMIQWVESQGHSVDRDQSSSDFDSDDDRYWYPRIVFKKSISDDDMDRMTRIQMDHDEAQLRREQGL